MRTSWSRFAEGRPDPDGVLDDTRVYSGVPAMTTRAVTTNLAFSTGELHPGSDQDCQTRGAVQ